MPRYRKTPLPGIPNDHHQQQQQHYVPPYRQQQQQRQRRRYEDEFQLGAQSQHYYQPHQQQQYPQHYPVPTGWNAEQSYHSNYGSLNWQQQQQEGGWYDAGYSAQGYIGYGSAGEQSYYQNNSSSGYREEPQINGWNGGYYSHDYYPSSYQPKRYEGNRHIHTPVSGRSSRYPSPTRRGNQREYEETRDESRWGRRDRFQDLDANPVVNEPRKHYLQQLVQGPQNYPINTQTPKPLPLLVLDLNGTLVYRSSRSSGTAEQRSKFPTLRPYLACFLQYCLAVDAEQYRDPSICQDAWIKWQEDRTKDNEKQDEQDKQDEKDSEISGDEKTKLSDSEKESDPRTHGTHFWPKADSEPEPLQSATYRLLLWSSAQPQNVDHMARAILTPTQAEQLLRVYARDTLVTRKFFSLKAPSVKDLEILWTALNNLTNDDESKRRGEERLFAEARDREDRRVKEDQAELEKLHTLWNDKIVLPKLNEKTGEYTDGFGYGPHNTLLLDDSISKARIQPFNHLLVPEFDEHRAKVVKKYKKKQASESDKEEEEQSETDQVEEEMEAPEDILLQIIGVLEHARYQKNISSWIRFGGLGNLGNVGEEHPYQTALSIGLKEQVEEAEKKVYKEWETYFSQDLTNTEEDKEPRLQVRVEDRTPTFWAEEGKRALSRSGIKAIL